MKLSSVKVALAGALLSTALCGCIVAPAPGYYAGRWVPHTWRPEGNRWHLQGGRWERGGREERGRR